MRDLQRHHKWRWSSARVACGLKLDIRFTTEVAIFNFKFLSLYGGKIQNILYLILYLWGFLPQLEDRHTFCAFLNKLGDIGKIPKISYLILFFRKHGTHGSRQPQQKTQTCMKPNKKRIMVEKIFSINQNKKI